MILAVSEIGDSAAERVIQTKTGRGRRVVTTVCVAISVPLYVIRPASVKWNVFASAVIGLAISVAASVGMLLFARFLFPFSLAVRMAFNCLIWWSLSSFFTWSQGDLKRRLRVVVWIGGPPVAEAFKHLLEGP
jgi:hypothetical protein